MNKIIFIGIFLFTLISVYGQNVKDSIGITNYFWIFNQNGKYVSYEELFAITKTNPAAYKELKTARNKYFVGLLYSAAVGSLINTLGNNRERSETKWNLIGGGSTLIVMIPFTMAFNKRVKNAVKIYNNGLKQMESKNLDFKND